MALWTIQEQRMIKPLDSRNEKDFAQLQIEVEIQDLQEYTGIEFYQELIRNPLTYATLLNGGTYTDNGNVYRFQGLKAVCAYLLYARYIRQSYVKDTASGMVQHTGSDFQRISSGELKEQEQRFKSVAGAMWDECLRYMAFMGYDYCQTVATTNTRFKFDTL